MTKMSVLKHLFIISELSVSLIFEVILTQRFPTEKVTLSSGHTFKLRFCSTRNLKKKFCSSFDHDAAFKSKTHHFINSDGTFQLLID